MPFLSRYLWFIALVASLGFFALESLQLVERIEILSAKDGGFSHGDVINEAEDADVPSVRHLVSSDRNDDLHWVVNSQWASEIGQTRLREVGYDNAPAGRESHWASVYSWWIRLLAFGDPSAMEWSSLWANALLAGVVLIVLAVVFRDKLGPASAVVTCLCFCSLIPLRDVFKLGMGDHHAAAIFSSLLTVSFMVVALKRVFENRSAAGSILTAAAFSALGMWINVVSSLPIFLGVGLSFLCIRFFVPSIERAPVAAFLRNWSRFTALFSLLFYFVEYAPSHFAWRLEVNHPLYAVAVLGAGEFLALLFDGGFLRKGRLVLSCVFVFQLPVTVFLFRESVFQVSDPFLMAVHDRYIMEFQGLLDNLMVMTSPVRITAMVLPLFLLPLSLVALFVSRKDRSRIALLLLSLGPVCILFLATLYQARWWSELAALLVLPAALLVAGGRGEKTARLLSLCLYLSLVPGVLIFVMGAFASGSYTPRELSRVSEKSVAHYLRARAGEGELVVLASPDATTNMIYYGGAKGIGTFYWENNEGLKRAASMFAAPTMDLAQERIEAAGVTHVVVYSWGGFEKEYLDLHRDFGKETVSGKPFLMRLMEDQEIPLWLRPIPFQLPKDANGVAIVYEVVPEQTVGQLVSRRFEYMLEMGLGQSAFSLEPLLREHSGDLSSQVSLCRLLALQKRGSEFIVELDRLRSIDGSEFRVEDLIRYCGVLLIASKAEEARSGLGRVLSRLDEDGVRDLNGETMRHLWDLVDALEIGEYDPRLRSFSEALLPNRLR